MRIRAPRVVTAAVAAGLVLSLVGLAPPVAGGAPHRDSGRAGAAPADEATETVERLYQVELGRPADPAGRDYWTGRVEAGATYDDVVMGLGLSGEGRRRAVDLLYRAILGRAPDPGGRAHWTDVLVDTGRADVVATKLLASAESYQDAGGTPETYIEAMYQLVLGRSADAGGMDYWLDRFGAGLDDIGPREQFVTSLIHSAEAIGHLVELAVGEACSKEPTPEEADDLEEFARTFHLDPVLVLGMSVLVSCPPGEPNVRAGAASRSVLPTVDGSYDYLEAGLPPDSDAFSPGVFVPEFDQGRVDVDNGDEDAAWVHDDLLVTALAVTPVAGGRITVLVSADLYMVFTPDGNEMAARARALLPPGVGDNLDVIVSATHNHHGPVTAFGVNDTWYDYAADQAADAIVDAVESMVPARAAVAAGEHRFGVTDARDPAIVDPRLNVLSIRDATMGSTIATVVQWSAHPETTLGWEPPGDIAEECAVKGWTGEDCTSEGRYFSSDYPGEMRETIQDELGGEVLYFVGPIGSQIGPGDAAVWEVDADHPVGDGWSIPEGAAPATPGADSYTDESFAKATAIGTQLGLAALDLVGEAEPLSSIDLTLRSQSIITRLSNIGFRYLLALGELGWQPAPLSTCEGPPSPENCTDDGGATYEDDVIGGPVRVGNFVELRVHHLSFGQVGAEGGVGFLFMPGEVAPELVTGVPSDYVTDPEPYHFNDQLSEHPLGSDYTFPGYLLDLLDETEAISFTVGLGDNELGYFVTLADFRVRCVADELAGEGACTDLYESGAIEYPDAVAGQTCKTWADTGAFPDPDASFEVKLAIAGSCTYGQALGEASGHYEETNSAGWDLVEDLWRAAEALFGPGDGTTVNPALVNVLPPDSESFPAPPAP